MKFKINFILSFIVALFIGAFQLYAYNGVELNNLNGDLSRFENLELNSEIKLTHESIQVDYLSDQTQNRSKLATTTKDENFDDEETNSKKRFKVLKECHLQSFFQNHIIYSYLFRNELEYYEHFLSRSFRLYVLIQAFRI